jgi:hypothetical protein
LHLVEQSRDFVWDEEESGALRDARKGRRITLSVDSMRAYLKQIGNIALLNAEGAVAITFCSTARARSLCYRLGSVVVGNGTNENWGRLLDGSPGAAPWTGRSPRRRPLRQVARAGGPATLALPPVPRGSAAGSGAARTSPTHHPGRATHWSRQDSVQQPMSVLSRQRWVRWASIP